MLHFLCGSRVDEDLQGTLQVAYLPLVERHVDDLEQGSKLVRIVCICEQVARKGECDLLLGRLRLAVVNLSDSHRKILQALYELREIEGPYVGFSQRKIADKSGVPQSTISDNRSYLVKSLRWVWEPEGGGLALLHDADPTWWEKGDALVGFPRPEQVSGWWGEA